MRTTGHGILRGIPLVRTTRRRLLPLEIRYQHSLAITYSEHGDPSKVLKLKSFPIKSPDPLQLGLKFLLSPLNPADINTIEGRYPWRPKKIIPDSDVEGGEEEGYYIAGNEGLAQVTSIGSQLDPNVWKIGDWVVMGKPQLGTWRSSANLLAEDVIKLPRSKNLTKIQAATISVNLSTAYRLIKDYLPQFSPDTWIIQNGANSCVGQYVLQLCKTWNLGCIGLIRDRPYVQQLKSSLMELGAPNKTHIFTYDEVDQDSPLLEPLYNNKPSVRLALNCVSGNVATTSMMRWLEHGSRLITYGGMSMKPLVVPTSSLIFKDIKLEGFMLTNWLMKAAMNKSNERKKMLTELLTLIDNGHLKQEINADIVPIDPQSGLSNLQKSINMYLKGQAGKKFLFQFPE